MNRAELEICIDSADSLDACLQPEVDRVELCSALALGGLTPSAGLMRLAVEHRDGVGCGTTLMAMIRPRAGDFRFSPAEVEVMCADIRTARDAGVQGVVLGAATADGQLDTQVLQRLSQAARGMSLTLHRVIDLLDDPLLAIDQAVDLGFDRILSSGGALKVSEGLLQLTEMQRHAAGRITIMAGAGLSPALARLLYAETGIRAFHASCRTSEDVEEGQLMAFGFGSMASGVDSAQLGRFRRQLDAVVPRSTVNDAEYDSRHEY